MGAFYIKDLIANNNNIENINATNNFHFTFDYCVEGQTVKYIGYAPTRDDYEISIELVERVISKGYNLIVYDSWIIATNAALNHAAIKGLPTYDIGSFIKKIKKNEPL